MTRLTLLITALTIATCLPLFAADVKLATPAPTTVTTVTLTLTLADLVNSQSSLSKLFSADLHLPPRVSWNLGDIVSAVESKLTHFNNERTRLIKLHKGALNANLNVYTFPDAEVAGWEADMKVLSDIKVELTLTRIPLSALPDTLHLSPADMARLRPFLSADDDAAVPPPASPAVPPPSKTK